MKSKKDILKEFKDRYQISKAGCRNQYNHIQECQSFYSGDYMNYKDEFCFLSRSSGRRKVKEVQFNRVKPYINSIVGFMAGQRRKPDYQAKVTDSSDQKALSDYLNFYSDHIRENTNADQVETRQDMDLAIGGIGATDTGITIKQGLATRTPNGETLVERVNPTQIGWDPLADDPNILSSRWVYRVKDYELEEAEELFNADEKDFEVVNPADNITNYEYYPEGGIQDKIGYEFSDPQRRLIRVYFYQWFDIETFYRIENPMKRANSPENLQYLYDALTSIETKGDDGAFNFDPTAEILIITKQNRAVVKDVFDDFGIPFLPVSEKRKVYYTAIISGDKVFTAYKSVSQQGFTIKFKTGDRDEQNNMWTGVVASMRQPQRYYNKALTQLMLIIANNARGGVLYEEDAVDNIQEFEASWAMMDRATRVNSGALSNGKIQPKATPHMATGYEGILEASSSALGQVTGIDESFFGAIAGGNETAMLQRQRIKQAINTLACYFDSITLYAKEQARMMLSFMRLMAASNEGVLFMVSDDDGNPVFERVSIDYFVEDYEIKIGEAPENPVQKEFYTQTLINMAQSMQAIGDPRYKLIYAEAIKYMPISNREKNAIIKILVGEEKIEPAVVQQLQEKIQSLESQQAQLISEKMVADINKTNADMQEKLAKAKKTFAEIEHVIESTEQKALENDVMALQPINEVNVNI